MGTKVVAFSLLDVCVGLGLRVVGQNIDLTREGLDSHCKKLFGPKKVVDVEMVVSDVAASADELSNTFVKEGFEEFGRGSKGGRKDELMEVI
ncbi:hypothetical protein DEO72_LG2g4784 [Vigna unguiculata]|uniref:Uncharacterized protein n=1 Tax=Vigna unguiculata TaxID=3917 RepID=A0A4D6L7H5_VIGUN|nr:hypothetical protein DEO72_LG2g4784 [Vigna unguiculata]